MRSHGILVLAVAFGGWVAGADRGHEPTRAAELIAQTSAAIDCDDGNACTIDLADPALGCRWIAKAECEDDDLATANTCTPSGCTPELVADDIADTHTCEVDAIDPPGRIVATGAHHTLAVDDGGRLFAWGDNGDGQLGSGAIGGHRHRPHAVGSDFRTDARALAAGSRHSVAIRGDGTVSTWGRDGEGDVRGAAIPHAVVFANGQPLSDVIAVAAGRDVSYALAKDGTVWSWGTSGPGRLGDGTRGPTHRTAPVQVLGGRGDPLADVVAIEAASDHATALTKNGEIFAWGGVVDGRVRLFATAVSDPRAATRLASR
jgi:hypothetical protein